MTKCPVCGGDLNNPEDNLCNSCCMRVANNPSIAKRALVLDKAKQYVTKDRTATHGKPESNFRNIANLWEAYLKSRGIIPEDQRLENYDIAALMLLMKTARLISNPKHLDSWIDTAGYAACGADVAGAE